MKIVGRKREQEELSLCLQSNRPEFLVVYGRRRVGKTYLIKEYFNNRFSFYATGLTDERTKGQLKAFSSSLAEYTGEAENTPGDWFEAFSRLKAYLSREDTYREPSSNKLVVFLDELPWMDTARSDFKSALEFFWNSWGASNPDLLLIVCGSATSWIIDNLLKGKKGFHNRVTRRIRMMPFTLKECEELLSYNGMVMTRNQIIESYMIFGGIAYYLDLFNPRLSLAQNVDELCFKEYGALHDEYNELFHSLFKHPTKYISVIEALSKTKDGMTRTELANIDDIGGGAGLTKVLEELEQCGFIRKYKNYTKQTNNAFFQLVDSFMLFSLKHLKHSPKKSWMEYINTPSYNAWRGNAFEIVCLNHVKEIKAAMSVAGVESNEFAWRSESKDDAVQIDLIIDRADGIINLCEMKCTNDEYELDSGESKKLAKRLDVFQKKTKTKKAVHVTLVTNGEFKRNKYSDVVQSVVTGDELF